LWTVFEALASEVIAIGTDKAKARRGVVLYCGEKQGAIDLIAKLCPSNTVVFGTATAGNRGTATAGYAGTATSGYAGTATAGYAGTASCGNRCAAGRSGAARPCTRLRTPVAVPA